VSEANQINSRNRGHRVKDVIDELNLYVRGWLNYYKYSSTYSEVKDLAQWVRRRVRLYYWKQWSRSEAETACRQAARRAGEARQPAAHASPESHCAGHQPEQSSSGLAQP
jgi:hypothetical protein